MTEGEGNTMEITLNVDDMTYGQTEFLEDFTEMDLDQLMERIQTNRVTTKMTIAMLAMSISPEDPAAALDQVRQMKISETQVN
jgi:hypothetical protein